MDYPEKRPGDGLTRADLRRLSDMAGASVTISEDPELIEDVAGGPLMVGESVDHGEASMASVAIPFAVLAALGVTDQELADDFPNIRVVG